MGDLSDTARAVAGAWFGMMKTDGKSHLTFQMRKGRPSTKAQAGLDELVAAGVIKFERLDGIAVRYTPLENCWGHFQWLGKNTKNPACKFNMMDDIEQDARS